MCLSVVVIAQKEERKNEDKPAESSVASKKIVVSTSMAEKPISQMRNLPQKKPPVFTSTSLSKHPIKHSAAGFKGVIPKKSSLSAGSPTSSNVSSLKPSPLSYGTSSVSKKANTSSSTGGGLKRPIASSSLSSTSGVSQAKLSAITSQSQPNSQIRQNIRRSLKEILWKR